MMHRPRPVPGDALSSRTVSCRAHSLEWERREGGFALLATLWLLVALSLLAAAGLTVARTGSQVTRNRILLARAAWAREACVEILLARFAADAGTRRVPTVDLGRRTWCRADLADPAALLHEGLFDSSRARALGVPDSLRTTRGTGVVNLNAAPAPVLRFVPGLGDEAIRLLLERQRLHRPIGNVDELLGLLSPSGRRILLGQYVEFLRVGVFAPTQLVGIVDGGVGDTPITARVILTCVPVPGRLAVIRRESE